MKKILGGLLLLGSSVFAIEYYSKIEPINIYSVKSAVSGSVVFVNKDIESKQIKYANIIKLDTKVNQIDLEQSKIKLEGLKEMLDIENSTLDSFNRISSKSKFDKDNQKIKILTIESTISDLKTKIATLEDTISKKILNEENKYIYNVEVEVGDYVNPGTLLYTAMDLSSGKVEIFIPIDNIADIKTKTIYLDDEKSDLKISKLYNVADTKHISSYKCEIIIPNPKTFSKLAKIEFK